MKKITLLLLTILTLSCGNNKEEQMLYDYQQKNVKALNFDLKDLDYNVQKIEKVTDITATDSLKHVKKELTEYWEANAEQSLVDTLSFKYVISVITDAIDEQGTLRNMYHEASLEAIRNGTVYSYRENQRKYEEAIDRKGSLLKALSEIKILEKYHNKLLKKQDSILSTKYKANYSLKNPMISNTRQTFDKIFYTNAAQTEFIKEESIEIK